MIQAAALVLVVAVLVLTGSSVAWLQGTAPSSGQLGGDPSSLLATFVNDQRGSAPVELAGRYAGRNELLDPRAVLPSWHRHPRGQAAAVYAATRQCPPGALPEGVVIDEPALTKALSWHTQMCAGGPVPGSLLEQGPFMHPSGASYGALVFAAGKAPGAITSLGRSLHVLELRRVPSAELDAEAQTLGRIDPRAWEAITHGDRLVLSATSLIVVERGEQGLGALRVYERAAWDRATRAAGLALVPRSSSPLCARPASSALCWEPLSPAERHREALTAATAGSASTAAIAGVLLVIGLWRERRRLHADRIHVLRTLTHELRTPATSLGLDIEPLRAAYDDLPSECQEPVLRLSDGIARLNRVLHRSARYLALFEPAGASREGLVTRRSIDSAAELMSDLAEEWPPGITLKALSPDGALVIDPEWLSVAVRNLVENAARHGQPPVEVTWALGDGTLVVRVSDAGTSHGLSLKRAATPHHRHPQSVGLGLGLALVDRVARLFDARLSHQPSPTTFELQIPVDRPMKPAS